MTSTFETNVDAVLSDLDAVLKAVSSLELRVYKGFYKDLGDLYPSVLYMPSHDRPRVAATRNDHLIDVDILLFFRGGDNTPSEDVDGFISVIGDVYEAIETAQDQTWRWVSIKDVDMSFNRDKSLIFYICHMIATFEVRW